MSSAFHSDIFGVDIDAAARKIQSIWKMYRAKRKVEQMKEEERELLGLAAPAIPVKPVDLAREHRKILQRQCEMDLMVKRRERREECVLAFHLSLQGHVFLALLRQPSIKRTILCLDDFTLRTARTGT